MSRSYPSSFVMSLDRILRSFSHPSRSSPSNNYFFAGAACVSRRTQIPFEACAPLCKGCAYESSRGSYVNTEHKTLGLSEIYVLYTGTSFILVRHMTVQAATKWCRLGKNWPLEGWIIFGDASFHRPVPYWNWREV